jgi:hypothetical protein
MWKVVAFWAGVKTLNQMSRDHTEANAVRKGEKICIVNGANAGSYLEGQTRGMKIVFEVKFPDGKIENSVKLRAAAADRD